MGPATGPRSCAGGTDSDPCQCMKRASRRSGKEDRAVHTPTSSDLAGLFALSDRSENPPSRNRKSSSSSIDDTLHALRTFRQLFGVSEMVTASPTKSSSRRSSARKLQRSLAASSRVEEAAETSILQALLFGFSIPSDSNNVANREPDLQAKVNDAPKKYPLPLEDISMKVCCNERHVTTWDEPDHSFFLFPAQLLIACTPIRDFDPLLVPDVTLVHLVCSTVAISGPYKSHSQISFKTFYDGATIRYVKDTPTPDVSRGIHIGEVPWCATKDGDDNVGWCMRFWIPIPFALFQRAETRTFKIDVRVRVNGEDGKEGFLNASSDFTLSRLLRGLVM